MTPLPSDLRDDSSIHASGRRAVTTETPRARAGLTGRQGQLGIKSVSGYRIHNPSAGKVCRGATGWEGESGLRAQLC